MQSKYLLPGVGMLPLRARGGNVVDWATVDLADLTTVEDRRWYRRTTAAANCVYAASKRTRREMAEGHPAVYHLHRLIMGLPDRDPREVDHRNGNGLDNRRDNMRIVSHAENQQNRRSFGATSQYRGVCFDKRSGKWRANVMVRGTVHQGEFRTEMEAHAAVVAWREEKLTHSQN